MLNRKSSFSTIDMKAEREIIMKKAVPDIQNYCAEHGLHFQLIDMPWSDVADCEANKFHQMEITGCQSQSMGPNFIVSNNTIFLRFIICSLLNYNDVVYGPFVK